MTEKPFDWVEHAPDGTSPSNKSRRLRVLKGDTGPSDTRLTFPRPQRYENTDPAKVAKGLARLLGR